MAYFLVDITWIILLFIGLLALCHYLLLHVYRLSEKHWQIVEYLWLLLAFISLIGAVDDNHRVSAQLALSQQVNLLESKQASVINWLDNYQAFACNESQTPIMCNHLNNINNNVQLTLTDDFKHGYLAPQLFESLSMMPSVISAQALVEFNLRLTKYNDIVKRHQVLIERAKRSSFRLLLAALTPLIFVLALALKVTKVTSDYRALC